MRIYLNIIIASAIIISALSCTNPFAPGLEGNLQNNTLLGDQTNVDGIFQNFRYAYIFQDTVVYGKLLHDDFTFIYRNYDKGVDLSWGRDEDMRTTSRMFNATQNLDLIWNEISFTVGDSILLDVSRGFTLKITFSPTDIVNVFGRANFRLKRDTPSDIWKILQWRDESNY